MWDVLANIVVNSLFGAFLTMIVGIPAFALACLIARPRFSPEFLFRSTVIVGVGAVVGVLVSEMYYTQNIGFMIASNGIVPPLAIIVNSIRLRYFGCIRIGTTSW
jgi:hypothetical protein